MDNFERTLKELNRLSWQVRPPRKWEESGESRIATCPGEVAGVTLIILCGTFSNHRTAADPPEPLRRHFSTYQGELRVFERGGGRSLIVKPGKSVVLPNWNFGCANAQFWFGVEYLEKY